MRQLVTTSIKVQCPLQKYILIKKTRLFVNFLYFIFSVKIILVGDDMNTSTKNCGDQMEHLYIFRK